MACDKARGAVLSPLFPTEDSPVAIHFACPECKTAYTVNDRDAGKKSDCKVCGQRLEVPKPPARQKTVLGEFLATDQAPAPTPVQLDPLRPESQPTTRQETASDATPHRPAEPAPAPYSADDEAEFQPAPVKVQVISYLVL